MKKFPLLAAVAALGLGACGGEEHGPIPPTPIDTEAHFGISLCNCFEYEASDDKSQRLGMSVEAITDHYSKGELGYLVRYRKNGRQIREDVWYPDQQGLRLGFTRQTINTAELAGFFSPAVPLVSVGPADAVEVASTFTIGEEETPVPFKATVIPDRPVRYSTDGSDPASLPATQIHYEGMPFYEGDRYFVPDLGFVEISMEDETGKRQRFQLRRTRVLEGGCGVDGSLKPPTDICGSRI